MLVRTLIIGAVAFTKENDARTYQEAATNLRLHHTFGEGEAPSAFRPPGYPLFVLVAQEVTQTEWFGLRAFQVLLSVLSALALARAAGRWYPPAARVVLWALTLNPFDGYYAGAMLSETLSATLVTAAVSVILARRRGWTLGAGLIMGLAALTRDQLVLLPPAFAVLLCWLAWRPARRRRSRLLPVLLIPVIAAAVVLPWTIRNAVQFGRLIPISAGRLGYNLWLGTWELNGAWLTAEPVYPDYAFDDQAERELIQKIGPDLYTPAGDRALIDLALTRMKRHPIATLGTWLRRAPHTWFGTRTDLFNYRPELTRGSTSWKVVKAGHWGLNFFIVVLGFGALRLTRSARRLRSLVWVLAVPVLYTALVYLPLHSTENRYSHPVLQCLVALAAISARAIWRRRQAPFFSLSP